MIAEPYLAQIRKKTARHLYENGHSQQEIARLLQVSQAIVSTYINKVDKSFPEVPDLILSEANQISHQVAKALQAAGTKGVPESIGLICGGCKKLRQGSATCQYHKTINPYLEDNCVRCLPTADLIDLQVNRENIISNLRLIFQILTKNNRYNYVIPEIGLQIVMGTSDMVVKGDIAGFPGRIIKRKVGLPSTLPPVFGASDSMSHKLLSLKKVMHLTRGLAAIKTTDWLLEKLVTEKLSYHVIAEFDKEFENGITQIKQLLNNSEPTYPLIIVDQGSIGYEAITYIISDSAKNLRLIFDKLIS